jgi:hypothetical protein
MSRLVWLRKSGILAVATFCAGSDTRPMDAAELPDEWATSLGRSGRALAEATHLLLHHAGGIAMGYGSTSTA